MSILPTVMAKLDNYYFPSQLEAEIGGFDPKSTLAKPTQRCINANLR
jgi:hypothetical protein